MASPHLAVQPRTRTQAHALDRRDRHRKVETGAEAKVAPAPREKSQMPRGNLGLARKIELAQAASLAPFRESKSPMERAVPIVRP
jgi:hypothetical protein